MENIMTVEDRLKEANLILPTAQPSVANYLPGIEEGNLLFISGQLPTQSGQIVYQGKVGRDVDVDTAKKAAQLCALNVIGQAKAILGDLGRINRCIRLGGFVNCGEDFRDHAAVVNGASDLLVLVLGDAGRHARAAVGCSSLPLGAAVEIEAVFSIKPLS